MDCSLPESSVHGIFQARVLKWVAISFCRGTSVSRIKPGYPVLQVDFLPTEPPYFIAIYKKRKKEMKEWRKKGNIGSTPGGEIITSLSLSVGCT